MHGWRPFARILGTGAYPTTRLEDTKKVMRMADEAKKAINTFLGQDSEVGEEMDDLSSPEANA